MKRMCVTNDYVSLGLGIKSMLYCLYAVANATSHIYFIEMALTKKLKIKDKKDKKAAS